MGAQQQARYTGVTNSHFIPSPLPPAGHRLLGRGSEQQEPHGSCCRPQGPVPSWAWTQPSVSSSQPRWPSPSYPRLEESSGNPRLPVGQ